MKVMNIDATYGRIVFSDHEDERGTAYLYGIENDDGDVSLIRLDRAQRRTLAIALLGYDEQFVNDYGATIPSSATQIVPEPDEWEETGSEYRPYENSGRADEISDPTRDAPPITDADAPEDEGPYISQSERDRYPESEESYGDFLYTERDDTERNYTEEDIDKAVNAADQSAFERGYDAAVDDYRHGLWADEVEADVEAARARSYTEGFNDSTDERAREHEHLEAARYNETSFRTTLLDVQQWMAFEVEDQDRAVGHDRILSEVNETLSMDPMLGITPEGTDSMEQGVRWE